VGLPVEGRHAVGSHHPAGLCDCAQALELKAGFYAGIIPWAALCVKAGASRSKHPSIGMQQGDDSQILHNSAQLWAWDPE